MGAARYFVLLKVPAAVINDDYKEDRFGATENGKREEKGKWELMYPEERKGSPTGCSNQTAVNILGVDDGSIFWVIHPTTNHTVFSSNGFEVN